MTNIRDILRLSPIQAGLLFQTLYEPGTEAYISQASFAIKGTLKVPHLQRAFQLIIQRYDILRTAVLWEDLPEPVQVVLGSNEMEFCELDWCNQDLNENASRRRLDDFCRNDRQRGFDLNRPPLMRASLIRVTEQTFTLIWTWHHILLDGWSVAQLLPELLAAYEGAVSGDEPKPAVRRPYRDYIAWLQEQDLQVARKYWATRLEGLDSATPCPIPSTGPGDFTFRIFHLNPQQTHRLVDLSRRLHLTLNTIVQAAWALILSRRTGKQDVIFGGVVSGRPPSLAGIETMLGLFINTLPVRIRVSPELSIVDWLDHIQREQVKAMSFGYAPLSEIRASSSVPVGRALFESILVFENYPAARYQVHPAGNEKLLIETREAVSYTNFPLTLSMGLVPSFQARMNFRSTSARTEVEVHRLGSQLLELCNEMLVHPTNPVGSLITVLDRVTGAEITQERQRIADARALVVARHKKAQASCQKE